jgi:hypothetical protein
MESYQVNLEASNERISFEWRRAVQWLETRAWQKRVYRIRDRMAWDRTRIVWDQGKPLDKRAREDLSRIVRLARRGEGPGLRELKRSEREGVLR